jgi:hypothetical protein
MELEQGCIIISFKYFFQGIHALVLKKLTSVKKYSKNQKNHIVYFKNKCEARSNDDAYCSVFEMVIPDTPSARIY